MWCRDCRRVPTVMANPTPDGTADDFFEQIFAYGGGPATAGAGGPSGAEAFDVGVFPPGVLGLGRDQAATCSGGLLKLEEGSGSGKRLRGDAAGGSVGGKDAAPPSSVTSEAELVNFFSSFGHVQAHAIGSNLSPEHFHQKVSPSAVAVVQHSPAPRPRVRARRGQATDPHSIAERLRRERIAERMKVLQGLVPNSNKTDRAAMLDEIVNYVKFLRLQVKVLSMSRLGGVGAVAQLVADTPLSSIEGAPNNNQQIWEKWSMDGTERHVVKLMEEDVGAAMQFLQSKALCIVPISLAATIYRTPHQPGASLLAKPEPDTLT